MYATAPPFKATARPSGWSSGTRSCLCGVPGEAAAKVLSVASRAFGAAGGANRSLRISDVEALLSGYPTELIMQVLASSGKFEIRKDVHRTGGTYPGGPVVPHLMPRVSLRRR